VIKIGVNSRVDTRVDHLRHSEAQHRKPANFGYLRLTRAARGHLRQRFLEAEAGITGVNFAVAESGGFVVCTNEGNADLGVAVPPLHIACMGLEKLVPRVSDVAVFLRLLARSATGHTFSHTPHPVQISASTWGRESSIVVPSGRVSVVFSNQIDFGEVGQNSSQTMQFFAMAHGRQRPRSKKAVPMRTRFSFLSSAVNSRIAPVGHTSLHSVQEGSQ